MLCCLTLLNVTSYLLVSTCASKKSQFSIMNSEKNIYFCLFSTYNPFDQRASSEANGTHGWGLTKVPFYFTIKKINFRHRCYLYINLHCIHCHVNRTLLSFWLIGTRCSFSLWRSDVSDLELFESGSVTFLIWILKRFGIQFLVT